MPNLAPITVLELDQWLKENVHQTWYLDAQRTTFGPIKFLDFQVDTRFMHIWKIVTRGFAITTLDEGAGNLLTALTARLKAPWEAPKR